MTDKPIQLFENKYQCCGCNACEMVCGQKAITMIEDKDGFRFPRIDVDKCVGCGSCLKVCCIGNDVILQKPERVYAASYKNKDISAKSASGGIFAAFAKQVLAEGGIVFGSAYTKTFVFAGLIQCVQITWNARNIFKFQLKILPEKNSIVKLVSLAGPLLVGNAIYEINDIVDKQISSGLGHGGVSVLSYGASINEIVTSLIVTSLSTVLFSHYATWIAEGKIKQVGDNLKQSLEYLLVIIMPIMIMCFVAGDTIVEILYGRGSFDTKAITRTSGVVMGYAAGFFFQAARATIVKVYYAFQDTKTPMLNGAISVCVNVMLSIVLSRFMGAAGIAFATSIAMFLVTALLFPKIYKLLPSFTLKSKAMDYVKILFVSGMVWVTAVAFRYVLNVAVYLSFLIIGVYIVCTYIILLMLFKVTCVKDMISKIKTLLPRG